MLKILLTYSYLVEMMDERGIHMAHTTIMRWVHQFGPELDKRIRPYLKTTNDSFRTDETYIKVKGNGNIFTEQWIQTETRLISCCLKIEMLPRQNGFSRKH